MDAAIEPIKPIQCFNSSDTITTYVQAFTVWTVRESKIYLISEALINDKVDISIFVLQSKYWFQYVSYYLNLSNKNIHFTQIDLMYLQL